MKRTRKPCSECPFRKRSLPGWLGPWKLDDFTNVRSGIIHGETRFVCHETVTDDQEGELRAGNLVCTGSLICRNRSCKSSREPEMAALERDVREHEAVPDIMNAWEFEEHHGARSKS